MAADGDKGATKHILKQYNDALRRINILRLSAKKIECKVSQMNKQGYYVVDVVTRGKKGKKPLGTVAIAGFPHEEYKGLSQKLEMRRKKLMEEEQELVELTAKVEEYIKKIEDIEIRNIFTLYYTENLTWVQVAHKMNEEYGKKMYTSDSCRCKHDRFLEKK